jgi:hypothetical protein
LFVCFFFFFEFFPIFLYSIYIHKALTKELCSAEEAFTKYTIVKLLGDVTGRDTSQLTGNPNPPSGDPRPHNCKLDTTAMQLMGFIKLRNFRESLPPILQPWVNK